jgi:FAS-associated factor 2
MSILTYPFHVLVAVIRFIFQSLRIPIPNAPISFSPLSLASFFNLRSTILDPYAEADRWLRSLEEETGATCLNSSYTSSFNTTNKEVDGDAGPSGSVVRGRYGALSGGLGVGRTLPDFWLGSYEDALLACQHQLRIGCIVLVSSEHDDVLPFKRYVLIRTNKIIS